MIVKESELKERLDIGNRPTLVRYLVTKGIPFETNPKGCVWTVQAAIDGAIFKGEQTQAEQSNDKEWAFK